MILTLKVADATFEKYASYNTANPKLALTQQLTRFMGVDPTSRILILPKEERAELEALLNQPLESARELVSIVKRLLSVKVGEVEVSLKPDQAYRIEDQARFHGVEPREFLKEKALWALEYAAGGTQ